MKTLKGMLIYLRKLPGLLGWNRASYTLMSVFLAVITLIIVVWWPLVEEYFATADPTIPIWVQLDRLLLGIFLFMSMMIMAGADLRKDASMIFVGLCGGLVIEGWGTQTLLWSYYTQERPPLWIIPAWPIASLTIDRMVRIINRILPRQGRTTIIALYWLVFSGFYALMLVFVAPTLDKSLTVLALLACALIILSPTDHRLALITFAAGSGLGYFLELWGTTRLCWTYYTLQTPPVFAVVAHGLAAVAFWRARLILERGIRWFYNKVIERTGTLQDTPR